MSFIIGKKLGMTRVFDEDGRHVAVTKVAAMPCVVSQVKNKERDGYKAVQVKAIKNTEKDTAAKICEFRIDNAGRYKVGQAVTLKQFKKDELVTVTGTSKGKGFAGTVKRHSFHRGPMTHGSNNHREPGSIGGGYPQRVVPGRRMAGHMGSETITIQNLRVVDIEDDIILIAGAIPGPNKAYVKIFGKGEIAEEEVDYIALEEERAKEKMLEEAAEEKAEAKEAEKAEPEEAQAE